MYRRAKNNHTCLIKLNSEMDICNNCIHVEEKFFISVRRKNRPHIMSIGPLMRKLIFWGAHSIFGDLRPNRGPNIDFRKRLSEQKLFISIRRTN